MKVRNSILATASLVVMMASASCSRDHLFYEAVSRTQVQLDIDWSQTAFSADSKYYDADNRLNGVTVFAFDSATHRLVTELPPDANWQSPCINLKPGTYDLMVINDSRAELPDIKFDMALPFEEFKAYVDVDTVYTEHPDYLTVSTVRNVSFNPETNDYYYDRPDEYFGDIVMQKLNTVQHAVTKRINLRVYVKGINYCRGMMPSFMTGLSKWVNLATETPGKDTAVYAFNLINREYRTSDYTEALLTQTFNCFSFNAENLRTGTKFELTLNFVLIDNSIYTVKADATPQFEKWLEEHTINCDLDLDIDVDMMVELPPTEPTPPDAEGIVPETIPWNDITQNITL
ncbi:MAG: DUF5119 domain-containing protein [Muribaculaceae bacterium]